MTPVFQKEIYRHDNVVVYEMTDGKYKGNVKVVVENEVSFVCEPEMVQDQNGKMTEDSLDTAIRDYQQSRKD